MPFGTTMHLAAFFLVLAFLSRVSTTPTSELSESSSVFAMRALVSLGLVFFFACFSAALVVGAGARVRTTRG